MLAELGRRAFGIYVHVPFCASRCGYCDFNTYTAAELGGSSVAGYVEAAVAEITLAATVLGDRVLGDEAPSAQTVFFGGGTPTLLPPSDLARILGAVRDHFGLTSDAEITTEANPESVTAQSLEALRRNGFTRISFGMQSIAPHVLHVLDRRHTPGRTATAVAQAQAAGFEHVNVDLIYGTPGESDADWKDSLHAAIATGADHVSAYSLIVEPGTRLATDVRRGRVSPVDDDALADRYLMADDVLTAAGFDWYEVSNWARSAAGRSRHNLLYWTGGNWWGVGPGAHSHIGGVRWWNVKHPAQYAERLRAGSSPAAARETLTVEQRQDEDVMLRIRLVDGLPISSLPARGRSSLSQLAQDGLIGPAELSTGRVRLTLRGRLLADAVVRTLLD